MPRDKRESHERVLAAAREEFMEKGFEGASIRAIASRAGMTSGGLYRHCRDKEDLLRQILQPMLSEMEEMMESHKNRSYGAMRSGEGFDAAFESGEIEIFTEMSARFRGEMKLLLCHSKGTEYESFLHDMVTSQQREMMEALDIMREHGYPVMDVTEKEMHLFLSAYLTAIVEPIIHDYSQEETETCLKKISEFFMPGWKKMMGL